jgi:hypothetical protein
MARFKVAWRLYFRSAKDHPVAVAAHPAERDTKTKLITKGTRKRIGVRSLEENQEVYPCRPSRKSYLAQGTL